MAYVIPNNSFSTDILVIRLARLFLLSSNISPYLVELMFPPEYVAWVLNAYDKFNAALGKQTVETGEKEEAFRLYDLKAVELEEYYALLKSLLIARYRDSELPVSYGLKGDAPESKQGVVKAAEMLINGHNSRVAVGDPRVLPDTMIVKITDFLNSTKTLWAGAYSEADDVESATAEMRALFDEDTEMLREVYNWICAMWRRDDPRLIEIGFVQRKYEGGGGGGEVPDAPINFEFNWLDPVLQFRWDPVESATSYQLAFSEDGGEVWEELYTGEIDSYEYEPPEGLRQYRVRARNADGYGDWSLVIEFEVEGAPPVGDWPNAPSEVGAELITDPSTFMRVYYAIPGDSDSVNIYRAVVPHGNAAPERPATPYTTDILEEQYADTDVEPGNDYYYWVCGVKGGEEGDFAGPAIGEV